MLTSSLCCGLQRLSIFCIDVKVRPTHNHAMFCIDVKFACALSRSRVAVYPRRLFCLSLRVAGGCRRRRAPHAFTLARFTSQARRLVVQYRVMPLMTRFALHFVDTCASIRYAAQTRPKSGARHTLYFSVHYRLKLLKLLLVALCW